MLYIMIKPEGDNIRKNAKFDIFVGGELYTVKEWEKVVKEYLSNPARLAAIAEPVEVSKKSVYWFFGARFSPVTDAICENRKKVNARYVFSSMFPADPVRDSFRAAENE